MRSVGQKNTRPELAVRKILHRSGYRFRLHRRDLPGTPDVVLPKYRSVIFVHGCFWHGHGCKYGKLPKSNKSYWSQKIQRNINRDARTRFELERGGWKVFVVWQCELGDPDLVQRALEEFLEPN